MLDIKFVRENPDVVKQNIKNKFQEHKLPLVDEVIALDKERRETQQKADDLRALRKKNSKMIGALMGQGKKEEAEAMKEEVAGYAKELSDLEAREVEIAEELNKRMMVIPNIIDPSVPIGKNDTENVEIEKFGDPVFRILKSHIMHKLWNHLMDWIWIRHVTLQEMDSII